MTTVQAIKHTITINAPVERVWSALTTPEDVRVWVGAVGFKSEVGAKFEFHAPPQGNWDGITHSEVLEITPPTRLKFTWTVPNFPATYVTFTLRDLGAKTEVTLEHTGWDQFGPEILPIRDQLDQGWGGQVLPQLTKLVETRSE